MSNSLCRPRRPATGERGATLVESALCLLMLVLAGLVVFEIAQWHLTRQLARLALHEAARTGAVTNADPQKIQTALTDAMATRYSLSGRHGSARGRQRHDEAATFARFGLPPWHLEVVTPSPPLFADFSDATLSRGARMAVIRNDYLAQQHAAYRRRGWKDGRGPVSGKTIFEANTLRLRLTVLYAPRVPGVAAMLRMLPATGNPLAGAAYRRGLLTITIHASTAMHSNPMQWDTGALAAPAVEANARGAQSPLHAGTAQHVATKSRPRAVDAERFDAESWATATGLAPTASRGRSHPAATSAEMAPSVQRESDRLNRPGDSAKRTDALCGTLLCCPVED